MPSKDTYHARHPEKNAWMERDGVTLSSDPERLSVTAVRGPGRTASRTVRNVSGQLMRLAQRLGVDPDELAKKIPADTVRRTKYPVIEVVNEDGTRSFKHDIGVTEGPISAAR